jgi:hypothetical protein
VTCAITGGGSFSCNQASAVAGPGVEFTFGGGGDQYFSVDFGPSDVLLTVLAENSLGATILNSQDLTQAFTSATLLSTSGFTGFSASNISLSSGTLLVDLIDTSSVTGAFIDIGLGTSAAPEPATAGLAGVLSMLLILCWMRSRKRALR